MTRRLYSILAAILFSFSSAVMAAAEFNRDHPERYTVVKGDTLWHISERFLKSPWLWPEVWHANPQIQNPHLIYPGDVIGLIYIDGQKRLSLLKAGPNHGVVKLSPQVRATPISTAIPTIPLEAISSFLLENRIVEAEEMNGAPYILSGKDERLISGAGDSMFARGEANVKDKLAVYRSSEKYVDPNTGEFLGLEAKAIANGTVTAVDGEVITFKVSRSSEELRVGDRLLQTEDRTINSSFTPSKPDSDIRGQMIAVDSGVGNIGQYNVVVINRGEREGLEEGNVMAIFKDGGTVRDPITRELIELPSERAGLLMVFRVFEKLSYGLILKATKPLHVGDQVRNP